MFLDPPAGKLTFWLIPGHLLIAELIGACVCRLSVAIRPPTVCLTLPVWFPRQQSRGCFLRRSSPQGCMKYFWLYFGKRDSRPVEKQKRQKVSQRWRTWSLTSDQLPSSPIPVIKISSSVLREETPQKPEDQICRLDVSVRMTAGYFLQPWRSGRGYFYTMRGAAEAGMCVQMHLWRNRTVILYINAFRHRHKSHSGFLSMQLKNEA